MYSAGVVLYECLVGKRPFDGSDADVIKAVDLEPRLRPPPESADASGQRRRAREAGDRAKAGRSVRAAPASSGRRSAVCLAELGASSKERDVTAALSALLEPTSDLASPASPAPHPEAVPEAIEASGAGASAGPASGPDSVGIALNEREFIEASGPLPLLAAAASRRRDPAA